MSLKSDLSRDLGRYNVKSRLFASLPFFLRVFAGFIMLPGFRAVYLYRKANFHYKKRRRLLAGIFSRLIRPLCGVEICPTAEIGPGFCLPHPLCVVVGGRTSIGADCIIMQGVTLGQKGGMEGDAGQGQPSAGDRVYFGAGAKVLGPVKIGNDARIGANAVVLSDVPEGATAVGVPARIIPKKGG